MESLVAGAEAWLNETGKLAATWLGDDPEETEAHVHMRHARHVALALERGAEPPPAPTVAPRYDRRADYEANGAEQCGVSDAEGVAGAARSKRRWRERPPPGSPAARAERARLVSDFREVVPSARVLSSDGGPALLDTCRRFVDKAGPFEGE